MTRPLPFMVLATQRSGSSWAQEMLNSHPDIRVYTELFVTGASGYPMWEPKNIEFAGSYLEARVRFPQLITHPYWVVRYLNSVFHQSDVKAVGLESSTRALTRVRLEVPELLAEFRRLLRDRERIRTWLSVTRSRTTEVEYETLAANASAFAPVLEFLGIPGTDAPNLQSGLEKARTRSQADVVENLAEVSAALSGTPYESFLEP